MMKTYTNYKASGVEWLGDIPEDWEVRKLKTLCQVKRGASPRPIDSPKYFDDNGEFGWVRISDVTKSEHYLEITEQKLSSLGAKFSVKMYPNDIFLSIAGSVGKAIITKVKCCIHDGFVYFKGLKLHSEFLYYLLQIDKIYEGLGKEGTQLNLNTETVGSLYLPFISNDEQQTIANYLDKKTAQIARFIENKKKLIQLLEEEKKALITQAVTRGLDKSVRLKPSGVEWLGDIPEHWEVRKLKFCINLKNVQIKSISKENYIGLENIESWTGILNTNENIIPEGISKVFDKGDLLFSKLRPYLAKGFIADFSGICSSELLVFNTKNNSRFFLRMMLSVKFIDIVDSSTYGSKMPRASWNYIGNIFVPLPSLPEQQAIVAHIEKQSQKIEEVISKYQKEIELIIEYRQRLIYDAVTGKIKLC